MSVPQLALLRGASLAIDFVLVGTLALVPMLFHGGALELPNIGFNKETLEVIAKANGASLIGVFLALTPLPIIYLRLLFKRVMKSPTPGEAIVGITSYSNSAGIEGAIQEILYGLAQYFMSAFALVFGCLAAFIATLLPFNLIQDFIPWLYLSSLPGAVEITLAATIYALSYIAAVGFAFVPHSRTDLASYFDDNCQLEVKRLR